MNDRNDTDALPPTQWLILEVLAARARLGETCWTFPTRLQAPLEALARLGLLRYDHGVTPKSLRAFLTDKGRDAVLFAGYAVPVTVSTEWGTRDDSGDILKAGYGPAGRFEALLASGDPGALMLRTITRGPWESAAERECAEELLREWNARD